MPHNSCVLNSQRPNRGWGTHSHLLGTHCAHPRSIGSNRLTFFADVMFACPALATVAGQKAHGLLAAAAAAFTVFPTAALGTLSPDFQKFSFQPPKRREMILCIIFPAIHMTSISKKRRED